MPLRPLIALILTLASAAATAQSMEELSAAYERTCAPAQLARYPELREQCEQTKATMDNLAKSQARPGGTAGPRSSDEPADHTTQCACTRKLGRCAARATVLSQRIDRVATGLSSTVVVRTTPPAGQCVEVTVFLQETAHSTNGPTRRGHPLYQVIDGPNDVEWKNLSTGASRLAYRVLDDATECYVCDGKRGGNTGTSAAADAAQARRTVQQQKRASYERQYRECVAGQGPLVQALPPAQRPQFCASIKDAMERDTD